MATYDSKFRNRIDAIKLLLSYDADINLRTISGFTPLYLCSNSPTNTNIEVINLLVAHGANISDTLIIEENLILRSILDIYQNRIKRALGVSTTK
jgi:ankyrin repeat protein